jgi:hypothetical protein
MTFDHRATWKVIDAPVMLFQVGHHGSGPRRRRPCFHRAKPKYAVISAGSMVRDGIRAGMAAGSTVAWVAEG